MTQQVGSSPARGGPPTSSLPDHSQWLSESLDSFSKPPVATVLCVLLSGHLLSYLPGTDTMEPFEAKLVAAAVGSTVTALTSKPFLCQEYRE